MSYKEKQRGYRRHLLMTAVLKKALPSLYSTEETPTDEKLAVIKFFCPYSDFCWYLVEGDPFDKSGQTVARDKESESIDWRFFGYVERGDSSMSEWGYSTLAELESATVRMGPFTIPAVERELRWKPKPMGGLIHPDEFFAEAMP